MNGGAENMAQKALPFWRKAQVVHMQPSYEGTPPARSWIETFAKHPEQEANLIELLDDADQIVIAHVMLALKEMRSSKLGQIVDRYCDHREKLTLVTGSFSISVDLGGFARRLKKEIRSQ